ncbi:MAG: hypothetical protein IPK16_30180, partial [Anaerolineales bacterium]|nr:hypothetical protein [Anaerolineales bacterium]
MSDLRVEHRRDALGIGVVNPRLSWRITTPAQNWRQTAYAVEAYTEDGKL